MKWKNKNLKPWIWKKTVGSLSAISASNSHAQTHTRRINRKTIISHESCLNEKVSRENLRGFNRFLSIVRNDLNQMQTFRESVSIQVTRINGYCKMTSAINDYSKKNTSRRIILNIWRIWKISEESSRTINKTRGPAFASPSDIIIFRRLNNIPMCTYTIYY